MISTAILLAAGEGIRLRSTAPLKPLCEVAGRSLLAHALSGIAEAGLTRVIVVLGYGAEKIQAYIATGHWPLAVETVTISDYSSPNGTSVLAAERLVGAEDTLLAMCDHLVEPALYRLVAKAGASAGARLAVDRRIESDCVDIDDVTRVQTASDKILMIGKGLAKYDCFDTGVFAIGPALFAALSRLEAPSLTEGIRLLSAQGRALIVESGSLDWIDVDDPTALEKAERWASAS